jgi:hypothetical protein
VIIYCPRYSRLFDSGDVYARDASLHLLHTEYNAFCKVESTAEFMDFSSTFHQVETTVESFAFNRIEVVV